MDVIVDVGPLSPDDVVRVAREGAPVTIGPEAREAIVRARKQVEDLAASDTPVYGVSTGFGALATRHIPAPSSARDCRGASSVPMPPAPAHASRTKWCAR